MNMKKHYLSIIFILTATSLSSQTFKWLPTLNSIDKKESVPVIIESNSKYIITYTLLENAWFTYYAYSNVSEGIRFDKYDAETGEILFSKTHMYEDDKYVFENVFTRENEIIALNYYYLGNVKSFFAKILIYDPETFELKGTKNIFEQEVPSALFGQNLGYNISKNKKHFLLSESLVSMRDVDYLIRKYDTNWELQFKDTIPNDNLRQIDDEGSIYYIRRGKNSDNHIVSHDVYKDYERWEEEVDVSFLNDEEEITNISSVINSDGDYLITGLYGNKKTNGKDGKIHMKGYLFLKVDKSSKEVVLNKKVEFSKIPSLSSATSDFLNHLKRDELSFNVVPTIDGGIVLAYEVKYKMTYKDYQGHNNTSHYFKNTFLVKLDLNGNLEWLIPIEKEQEYTNVNFVKSITMNSFSYHLFENNNKIFFFFYSGESRKENEIEPFGMASGGQFNLFDIDLKTGEMKKTILDQDKKGYVYVSDIFKKDGYIYFIKRFKDQYQIGKMSLE